MFTFKRLAELDFTCDRINQTLNKVCPELGISYEISDCARIRLHDLNNNKKIIEAFKFSNPETDETYEELAVLAVLKMFYYYLSNNMRVKSRKAVLEMFKCMNFSLNCKWK
jgi:hypothetical protein